MSRPYRSAPQPAEFVAARARHGLTVHQIAAMFGIDPATWRNWEAGRHTGDGWYLITFDFAVQRARALGILPANHPGATTNPSLECQSPDALAALIARAIHDLEHEWTSAALDVLHRAAQLAEAAQLPESR